MVRFSEAQNVSYLGSLALNGTISAQSRGFFWRLYNALRLTLAIPSLILLLVALLTLRPDLTTPQYIAVVSLTALACSVCMPRSDYRTFCLYLCGFALFNGLRTFADNTGNPIHFAYPGDIDRAVFGVVPTVWLQDRFYVNGQIGLLDWVTTLVYVSYFNAHYVVAGIAWAVKREVLGQHIGAILATIFIGLAVYYLLPTSPPWFAAHEGYLPEIFRIPPIVTGDISRDIYQSGSYIAGHNDVAAMPSLHTALTVVIALTLWRMHPALGVIGWLYVGAMGFSLVYLGEHYVVDVVAGIGTAVCAWNLTKWLIRADCSLTRWARGRNNSARQVSRLVNSRDISSIANDI